MSVGELARRAVTTATSTIASLGVGCRDDRSEEPSMGITKRELEQAFTDFEPKYGGRKEDYFAALWLAKEFKGTVDDFAHQVAFGGNDYGLDAFHVDREARNLYLFQFKWSESHAQFKDSFRRLTHFGMERIFGNPAQDQTQNQLLLQLKAQLHEYQAVIDRVLIHFVFNGDPEAAEQSAVLEAQREDLEAKKYLLDQFFDSRPVTLTFQFVSNQTKRLGGRSHQRRTHTYDLEVSERIAATHESGAKMDIGFIRIVDLHRMYREMNDRLFERNIRFGLSADRPANRAIKKALAAIVLDGTDTPEIFGFHHNGVTISVEHLEAEDGRVRLTEPRILNGAQTVTTFARFLAENEGNAALFDNKDRLGRILVLAKIVSKASAEFVVNVTMCNNQQNPVEPWHLRASDPMQLELQDKFRTDLGIYYERQENSFESLTDEDLADLGIEQYKAIQIRRLAQTLLASQGEIDRMSRLTDVFETEATYRNTFRESYLRSDARRIVFAYKMQFRLNRIIREILEKGQQKYAYIGRARYLVWALLIQAALNDEKLETKLEQFGRTLGLEADFTEYLRDLASRRVRLIISDALDHERYREMIEQEKYSFVRTKATFQRCMDTANDKYGWTRRAL
jgi:AIPR protein